jgi:RNA polymerase sigma factor for flagellar operon FliA
MNVVADFVDLGDRCFPAETFSAEAREHLILAELPHVQRLAQALYRRLPANVGLDDLVTTGVLGLISAIDSFDQSRQVTLRCYADHRIRGAMLDGLRQCDWAPRGQRKHAKQIEAAIAVAEQRLQRRPTEEEIAAALNLTVERYHQWQANIRGLNLARLESAGSDDPEKGNLLGVVSGDPREWPSALLERREVQHALAAAIPGIPDVEKSILGLHYCGGLTQREISKIVGLDKSRVAQLAKQAILRLRVCMAKYWPPTGRYPSFIALLEAELRGSAEARGMRAEKPLRSVRPR